MTGGFGPLGTGKSSAGAIKAWLYSLAWPGAKIAIIRDTYPNLIDTTQRTYFEWFPDGIAGEYAKTAKTFYLQTNDPKRPAELLFRAMDQKDDVTNILSMDLAAAHIDEPQGGLSLDSSSLTKAPGIDEELFQLLLSRLGRQKGYKPMCWMTGNPPAPSHWIARHFQYPGYGVPSNKDPDAHLYLFTREGNERNLVEGYYPRLEKLFGKDTPLARRFLYGEWIEFAQMNPFHKQWIRYWGPNGDVVALPKQLIVEIGFDPAISDKETSAKSALVVAGQCREGIDRGRIFILEASSGHWSVYEQVDQIIKAAARHKARAVRIEDVAYQRALKEILEHELRQRNINLYVDLVKPDGDKLRRASSWSAWVENGTVLLGPGQTVLEACMLSVPGDRTAWDLVDAAGICVRGFPALQGESNRVPGFEITKPTRAIGYADTRDTGQPQQLIGPNTIKNKKTWKRRVAKSYGLDYYR